MEQPQPEVRRLLGEEESRVIEKEDKEVVDKVEDDKKSGLESNFMSSIGCSFSGKSEIIIMPAYCGLMLSSPRNISSVLPKVGIVNTIIYPSKIRRSSFQRLMKFYLLWILIGI